jgi:hypothetical protein
VAEIDAAVTIFFASVSFASVEGCRGSMERRRPQFFGRQLPLGPRESRGRRILLPWQRAAAYPSANTCEVVRAAGSVLGSA